jgi:hypothetical protein
LANAYARHLLLNAFFRFLCVNRREDEMKLSFISLSSRAILSENSELCLRALNGHINSTRYYRIPFHSRAERRRQGERKKKVTNAITIIFNLYTYIRVFMVDGWESEAEQGDGGERERTRRRSRIL